MIIDVSVSRSQTRNTNMFNELRLLSHNWLDFFSFFFILYISGQEVPVGNRVLLAHTCKPPPGNFLSFVNVIIFRRKFLNMTFLFYPLKFHYFYPIFFSFLRINYFLHFRFFSFLPFLFLPMSMFIT